MDLNLGRIGQIAMSVADVDAAIEFYGTRLGLREILRPHATMVFFDCGGVSLYLQQAHDPADIAKASVLYFDCADLSLTVKTLEDRGVEVVGPPHRIAAQPAYDLWMAFIRDPDGHLLGLQMHAPKGWAPT